MGSNLKIYKHKLYTVKWERSKITTNKAHEARV